MPDWLRLRLIADLSHQQERAVRQALNAILLTALQQPRDGLVLDIAREPDLSRLAGWKTLWRDFLSLESEASPLRDYVFLSFLSGGKPSRLTPTVPGRLQRLLFRNGRRALGVRPLAALVMTLFFSLTGWATMSQYRPAAPKPHFIPHFITESNIEEYPRARSDSAWSDYANTFVRHQDEKSLRSFVEKHLPDDSTAWLRLWSGDSLAAAHPRFDLYRRWLAQTLSNALGADTLALTFYVQNPLDSTIAALSQPFYLMLEPIAFIPSGSFSMGSKEGAPDEQPEHEVYLDAFSMDKFEVTVAQYQRFVEATNHRQPDDWEAQLQNPKRPVVNVSWDDANAYAQWAGRRLPTEAEWEYAARGGFTGVGGKPKYRYPWGDKSDSTKANFDAAGSRVWSLDAFMRYLRDVGSYPPNGYGLYDMAGNVWEWCADWYDANYYQNSPRSNPKGPTEGVGRVLRGGSWFFSGNLLRCANRNWGNPTGRGYDVGFRCVRDVR
jgi:formylglycine-generating enzyme required for sulfatase activity